MAEPENQTAQEPVQPSAEQSVPAEEAAPTGKTKAERKTPAPRRRRGIAAVVLLALIAVGGGGYLGYRLELQTVPQIQSNRAAIASLVDAVQSIQESEKRQTAQQHSETQELQSQLQHQSDQLGELDSRLTASNAEFDEKLNAVIESASAIFQNHASRPDDWELDDVSLLLLIGAKQLQLTGDPTVVLPVWKTVADQVGRVSDPQLLIVRAQLNREIELLKTMQTVDLGSISTRLLELIDTIGKLPIRTQLPVLPADTPAHTMDESDSEPATAIGATLDAVWLDVKSLIRIRRISDTAALPINPNLHDDLVQHLKLSLAAAQMAALREQSEVYRANLEFVKTVIDDQFDVEASSVTQFSLALDDLLSSPLVAQVPDLSGSYQLLQEILNRPPIE